VLLPWRRTNVVEIDTRALFFQTIGVEVLTTRARVPLVTPGSTLASTLLSLARMTRPSFLDYTPVPLAFGTSGLRGLVRDLTDLEAYVNVKGALQHLTEIGDIAAGASVLVAGDLRPSTDRILRACARAIEDAGCTVENAGKIPTPALVLHGIRTRRAAVMVTGSHIPFDRNGIKLSKSAGEVLKSDEPGILRAIQRVRAEEYAKSASASAFDSMGMLRRPSELPIVQPAAENGYVVRYLECFPADLLRGLTILFYEHSAVGRDLLPLMLAALGAQVITAGRLGTFVPLDTEALSDPELRRLAAMVDSVEAGEGPVDVLVSTDGDSDRPLVIAVGHDPRGPRLRLLPGDLLGALAAEWIGPDAAAVPISANDAVERRMRDLGVELRKTKIGSPYVVAELEALRARHDRVVGWEANGGFLVGSDLLFGERVLSALPTRDAFLPIVAALASAGASGLGLDASWSRLPPRFGSSGLLDRVPTQVSHAILARLIPPGDTVEVSFERGAPAPFHDWLDTRDELERLFTRELGFGAIARINVLDGLRVHFTNGDVAHVRPSGNAPQLRLYANADSQARADEIVALALRQPDGILRRLQEASTRHRSKSAA
jgi:phosphomannomutase